MIAGLQGQGNINTSTCAITTIKATTPSSAAYSMTVKFVGPFLSSSSALNFVCPSSISIFFLLFP
jgi:hypothetical protein